MILIIDTETTGREPPEVLELAVGVVKEGSWELEGSILCSRFSSILGSSYGALATHHILDEEVAHLPAFPPGPLYKDPHYLIGHNIDYDWKAIGSPSCKRICTLAMSRKIWSELDSHTLEAMTYFIHGKEQAKARSWLRDAHSAESDVKLCHALLRVCLAQGQAKYVTTAEELWHYSEACRIPSVWSFGKHQGKAIRETDRGYLSWYSRLPDADPYVMKAVREALR